MLLSMTTYVSMALSKLIRAFVRHASFTYYLLTVSWYVHAYIHFLLLLLLLLLLSHQSVWWSVACWRSCGRITLRLSKNSRRENSSISYISSKAFRKFNGNCDRRHGQGGRRQWIEWVACRIDKHCLKFDFTDKSIERTKTRQLRVASCGNHTETLCESREWPEGSG